MMRTRRRSLIFAFIFVLFGMPLIAPSIFTPAIYAQNMNDLNPLHIGAIVFNPTAPKPGQVVELKIKMKIDRGFHAYVDQFRLKLLHPKNLSISDFEIRPQVSFVDPLSHKKKMGVAEYAEMVSLIDLPKDIAGGDTPLHLQLTYQACGQGFCLFPKKVPIDAHLQVAGPQASQDILTRALAKGWLYAFVIVFFAGVLTSFTPCIFPMIPITLAVLGTKDHGHRHGRGFLISVSYVLGIAITYSILGVIAAKTGAMFGSILGNPLVVGFIALLFVLMGLSMFGLFEIQLPLALANKLSGNRQRKGMIGAFGAGLVAGVVASPCVGPVLISVLAYVAQKQNALAGFTLLFAFALGLGQLFLLIGTFHTFWQKMPRSGPWMEQVKIIFGTMMIAMAFYYVKPVTNVALFNGLVATALVVGAFYFGAFRKLNDGHRRRHRVQKIAMQILLAAGLVFAIRSMAPPQWGTLLSAESNPASLTGDSNKAASSRNDETPGPDWAKYSDELLHQAALSHRPVIVDFNADWCLSCKELEKYTFSDPKILKLGSTFLWLNFDATSPSPELDRLQKKYRIGGLPFVIFFDKNGHWRRDLTLTGYEKAPAFAKRLQSVVK